MPDFAEILGEKVTLLAELAEWPDEIDVGRAEAARERAEERIKTKSETLDLKRAELALHRALTRITLRITGKEQGGGLLRDPSLVIGCRKQSVLYNDKR